MIICVKKTASLSADLSAGCAPGDTDEKRLSDNVGVFVTVPQTCFTVSSHTCNVPCGMLSWNHRLEHHCGKAPPTSSAGVCEAGVGQEMN